MIHVTSLYPKYKIILRYVSSTQAVTACVEHQNAKKMSILHKQTDVRHITDWRPKLARLAKKNALRFVILEIKWNY